jgi:hypothetical protein
MRQGEESMVRRLGKALQVRLESVAHEPLPRRWVELIHYLDEQERKRQKLEPPVEPS